MNSATADSPPKLISSEFNDVNRYWDHVNDTHAAKILPGEYFVSSQGELITTVLGSCVAACVRDRKLGIGGMNHFMLPQVSSYKGDSATKMLSAAGRYGNVAMERLINCILKFGGRREQMEFKIFGGANVLDIDSEVGYRNIQFVTEYLKVERLMVTAEDVGGVHPRKVNYYPKTGRVRIKKLRRIHGETLKNRERRYYKELDKTPVQSEIEVFT